MVCNKEGGFGEEDFVVEFLGEVWISDPLMGIFSRAYCGGVIFVFSFVFTKLYVNYFKKYLFSGGLQKCVGMTTMLLIDINLCSMKR